MSKDALLITVMQYLAFTADSAGLQKAVDKANAIISSDNSLNDDDFKAYLALRDEAVTLLADTNATDTKYKDMIAAFEEFYSPNAAVFGSLNS